MEIIDLAMNILILLVLFASIIIGYLIRKRRVPPFTTGYIMTSDKGKERQRNDPDIISFVSNLYYMVGISLFPIFLLIIFPQIKILEYLAYIFLAITLIYAFYKSIKYETHKNIGK